MIVGNRVPKSFFHTTGAGESDITVHAGSYHLALRDAGIEMANIMTYSSILPSIAHPIPKPSMIRHGEVMETIMAVAHCGAGETATAAVAYAWLYEDEPTSASYLPYGGLVVEYHGGMTGDLLRNHLESMLNELYSNGYESMVMGSPSVLSKTVAPTKRYGTAIAALCFTSYEVPVRDVSMPVSDLVRT